MLFHFYDFSPGHVCSNYTFIWQTRVHTTLHTYLVVQFSDSVAVQWCCLLEVPRDQQIKFIHTVSNSEFHECYSFHNFSLMPSKNLDKIWIKGSKFGCYEKDQGRILTRIKGLRSMIASLQIGN